MQIQYSLKKGNRVKTTAAKTMKSFGVEPLHCLYFAKKKFDESLLVLIFFQCDCQLGRLNSKTDLGTKGDAKGMIPKNLECCHFHTFGVVFQQTGTSVNPMKHELAKGIK